MSLELTLGLHCLPLLIILLLDTLSDLDIMSRKLSAKELFPPKFWFGLAILWRSQYIVWSWWGKAPAYAK
jgi:hypothetical protein